MITLPVCFATAAAESAVDERPLDFQTRKIPDCVHVTFAANGQALDSVGYIVLHRASRYIVDTIGAQPQTRFTAGVTGKTVSSFHPDRD